MNIVSRKIHTETRFRWKMWFNLLMRRINEKRIQFKVCVCPAPVLFHETLILTPIRLDAH